MLKLSRTQKLNRRTGSENLFLALNNQYEIIKLDYTLLLEIENHPVAGILDQGHMDRLNAELEDIFKLSYTITKYHRIGRFTVLKYGDGVIVILDGQTVIKCTDKISFDVAINLATDILQQEQNQQCI